MNAAESEVDRLYEWSDRLPFHAAVHAAPDVPGVYLVKSRISGHYIYVGMAGERGGKGIQGRLKKYLGGNKTGMASYAFDRCLHDLKWLESRLAEARLGEFLTGAQWIKKSIEHACLDVAWTTTSDVESARAAERRITSLLEPGGSLWKDQLPRR